MDDIHIVHADYWDFISIQEFAPETEATAKREKGHHIHIYFGGGFNTC